MPAKPLKVTLGPNRAEAYKCFLVASLLDIPLAVVPVEAMPCPVYSFPTAMTDASIMLTSTEAILHYIISQSKVKMDNSDISLPFGFEAAKLTPFYLDLTMAKPDDLTRIQSTVEGRPVKDAQFSADRIAIAATLLVAFNTSNANEAFMKLKYPGLFNFVESFKTDNKKKVDFAMTKANDSLSKFYPTAQLEINAFNKAGFAFNNYLNRIITSLIIEAFPVLGTKVESQLEEGKLVEEKATEPKGKGKKNDSKEVETTDTRSEQEAPELQLSTSLKIFGLLKGLKEKDPSLAAFYSLQFKSPKDIADYLETRFRSNRFLVNKVIERIEVGGRGFINIFLRKEYGEQYTQNILSQGTLNLSAIGERRPDSMLIGIDMSSPNIAKEMHVGHLRSTIIGEVLYRILTYQGHDVRKVNHIGDWGTAFGMLLMYLEETGKVVDPQTTTLTDLNVLYKASKARFDEDEAFKNRSRAKVVKLQSGEATTTETWKKLIAISEKGFKEVYERLDVQFPDGYCGESFYQSRIPAVMAELEANKLLEDYEGAKIVSTEAQKIPLFIQKSDGGFGYDSTDMAALKYRFQEIGFDKFIYLTDVGQSLHFLACFEVGEKLGWFNRKGKVKAKAEFVGFGLVCGKDGKRFRTRAGENVTLKALLDEAKNRIKEELEKRIESGDTTLSRDEIDAAAARLGYSAVKYCDLKNSREKDYIFDYDLMLQPTGNTGVYIIYTYARLCSIERKLKELLNIDVESLVAEHKSNLRLDKSRKREWEIVKVLLKHGDILEQTEQQLAPHILCQYIYDICSSVSKFYSEHQLIVNSDSPSGKALDLQHGKDWVCLLHATKIVLGEVAPLIGIQLLERV